LQLGSCGEPEGDGVAGVLIVRVSRMIMLRQQVVIQKDGVVSIPAQELARALDRLRDVQIVAFKTSGEPVVPTRVVVQEEDSDGAAL
jgi:hypothetical protein